MDAISYANLFKYQREGIEKLLELLTSKDGHRAALLADPPGAGKTPQAILTCDALDAERILILCPASLKENWKRECLKWSNGKYEATIIRSGRDVKKGALDLSSVVVCSYDLASREPLLSHLCKRQWDVLILDEAHYLKSPSSQRSRATLVLLWKAARYRLAITGTPLPNGRASEAWPLFSKMAPNACGDWVKFRNAYCIPEETPWGVTYPRSKNLEHLGKIARERFMVRRSKEEVLGQLPPLVRQNVPLEVPEIKVFEAQGEFSSEASMQSVVDAIESGIPLMSDALSTARRKLGVLKVKPALSYIKCLLEEVESCVVFAHHRDVIAELRDALVTNGISYVQITGDTPGDERQRAVDTFQDGRARVFLASITAASTGITLTRSQTVVFVECDWVPSTNEQAEGRVYRVSQKDITRAIYLTVPDSLDEAITRSVQRKSRDIRKVMVA